jgi:hypothetical protein
VSNSDIQHILSRRVGVTTTIRISYQDNDDEAESFANMLLNELKSIGCPSLTIGGEFSKIKYSGEKFNLSTGRALGKDSLFNFVLVQIPTQKLSSN